MTRDGESHTPHLARVPVMHSRFAPTSVALVALLFLAGCAAGPNELVGSAGLGGSVAGFWAGLWHGLISPFAFLVSLFRDGVGVYEVHNNGAWYDMGFLIGVTSILGGGGSKASRRAKRRRQAHESEGTREGETP